MTTTQPLGPTLVDLFLHLRKRLYFPYKRRLLRLSQSSEVADDVDDEEPQRGGAASSSSSSLGTRRTSAGVSVGHNTDVSPL